MSDFFQNGEISTFHRLKPRDVRELEGELEEASKHRPISLVLPYIPAELHGAGLPRIVQELENVNYLKNIIVPWEGQTPRSSRRQRRSSRLSDRNRS
jgi:glucosyl-3-phosphoglycerate synthase